MLSKMTCADTREDNASISSRKLILIGITLLLLLAGIYAHTRISGSEDYKGPLALLDRVFDLVDLYRRDFLERIYVDEYGYEIYRLK